MSFDNEFDGAEIDCAVLDDEFDCVVVDDASDDAPPLKRQRGPYQVKCVTDASIGLFCAFLAVCGSKVECWEIGATFAKQQDRLPHYEPPPLPSCVTNPNYSVGFVLRVDFSHMPSASVFGCVFHCVCFYCVFIVCFIVIFSKTGLCFWLCMYFYVCSIRFALLMSVSHSRIT